MSNFAFLALDTLSVFAQPLLAASEAGQLAKPGPWRPSEWAKPALTAITVPGTSAPATQSVVTDSTGNLLPPAPAFAGTSTQVLVFDAVLRVEHERQIHLTRHPIQTSASSPVTSVTDHAYMEPARVTLEIGMSDAMASYSPGAWQSASSKSVSAYQTLVALMKARTLVSLATRLDSYPNMIVETVRPTDTAKTRHGLRATVTLSEIFLADATAALSNVTYGTPGASDRPQLTGSTPAGTLQSGIVSNAVAQQHAVASGLSNVPGAGNWSSTNISSLGL